MNNLKEVEEFFAENGFGKYAYFQSPESKHDGVRLRLDFELTDEQEFTHTQVVYLLLLLAHRDLLDLALNGDKDQSNDAFLKTMDGAKKLDKTFDGYTITDALVYPEAKPRKATTEYTSYFIVHYNFR